MVVVAPAFTSTSSASGEQPKRMVTVKPALRRRLQHQLRQPASAPATRVFFSTASNLLRRETGKVERKTGRSRSRGERWWWWRQNGGGGRLRISFVFLCGGEKKGKGPEGVVASGERWWWRQNGGSGGRLRISFVFLCGGEKRGKREFQNI